MATNQTANYNLNQWLSTDQVLRTDFNADNAKLDAALQGLQQSIASETAARAAAIQAEQQVRAAAIQGEQQARAALQAELLALMPSVKLGEWKLTAAAQQLLVSLSGKDLSSFTGLRVVYDGRGCSGTICLQINGMGGGYRSASDNEYSSSQSESCLMVGSNENCRSSMEIFPYLSGLGFVWDQVSYYNDYYLNVSRNYGILPGVVFTNLEELKFYGIQDTVTMGTGTSVTVYGLRD